MSTGFYSLVGSEKDKYAPGGLPPEVTGSYSFINDEENTSNSSNEVFKLESVNFDKKQNRVRHFTTEYEIENLIVRRGQEFRITLKFNRPFDPSKHKFKLLFETGPKPMKSKGTSVNVKEVHQLKNTQWGYKVISINGSKVDVTVMSPASAIVGQYTVRIGAAEMKTFTVYILFNPWCKEDSVYMEDEDCRDEYVLNETGFIWFGSYKSLSPAPWTFGQFEKVSLTTSLLLLDKAGLKTTQRSNPVIISRKITEMANSADQDDGVLEGNWSGNYEPYTSPSSWNGSVEILEQYLAEKEPVRYGQCWVFSGIVTTLLRALGIPARSVTNFASAHDTDKSMTIDFHLNKEGERHRLASFYDDSVWNFHVWNETYFSRPDLPPDSEYRGPGWQALDATPQETSEGTYRCGPCPVKAIRNGDVNVPYDTGFLFAEVNGDRLWWILDELNEEEPISLVKQDTHSIGKFISTKAVGGRDREDVTNSYKYPEGSKEEQDVFCRVSQKSTRKDFLKEVYKKKEYSYSGEDVKFEMKSPSSVDIGKDFNIELVYRNTAKTEITVDVGIELMSALYTGSVEKQLDSVKMQKVLKGEEEATLTLTVNPEAYLQMGPDRDFKAHSHGSVKETKQRFVDECEINILKHPIQCQVLTKDVKENKMLEVEFVFSNPLPAALTNGVLKVLSPHMGPKKQEISVPTIKEGQQYSKVVKIKPISAGKRTITANFKCDQPCGFKGEVQVKVMPETPKPPSVGEDDSGEDEKETVPETRTTEKEKREKRERKPTERRRRSPPSTETPRTSDHIIPDQPTTDENKKDFPLKTVLLDFQMKKNRKNHHTDMYEDEGMIIRRGQEFDICLEFDRVFDKEKDSIQLEFTTGDLPRARDKSLIQLKLCSQTELTSNKWEAQITGKEGQRVHVTVIPSADALIGEYTMKVRTVIKGSGNKYNTLEAKEKIYLLFNAWCTDDAVFMTDDEERNEYVLNEDGLIWKGINSPAPWVFGQFDDASFKASLYLLKKKGLQGAAMGNPVVICRTVSAMVNSADEGGVLTGNWSGNYSDGYSPGRWTGSTAILELYLKTGQPVRYGQCWVFSGITTTVLRALGIPARSVTNFSSAHDTDNSNTIDYHFDWNGESIEDIELKNDSIWNFHVWNEAFFRRPDLPVGYDGWQAVDATPQELSGGSYRCGPCPVRAVKEGMVHFNYDTGFVFSEVNGDKIFWVCSRKSEHDEWDMMVVRKKTKAIGKDISTKKVGEYKRHDLTGDYKYPEGSEMERNAVRLATSLGTRRDEDIFDDPKVTVEPVIPDDIMIGKDFTIKLVVQNKDQKQMNVQVNITTQLISYTGAVLKKLKLKMTQTVTVDKGKEEQVLLHVKVEDYAREIISNNAMKILFSLRDVQSGQVLFVGYDVVEFLTPSIKAEGFEEDVTEKRLEEPFEMKLFFTNPIPYRLENASFSVSLGHKAKKPQSMDIKLDDPVEPYKTAHVKVPVTLIKTGYSYITATFESNLLSDVHGKFKVKCTY